MVMLMGLNYLELMIPISFIIGFVLSTGLIHLFGIGTGYFCDKFYNGKLSRIIGILITITGLIFVFRIYI